METLLGAIKSTKDINFVSLITMPDHFVLLSKYDLRCGKFSADDLKSIVAISPLGGAVPPSCDDKLRQLFPNLQVCNYVVMHSM